MKNKLIDADSYIKNFCNRFCSVKECTSTQKKSCCIAISLKDEPVVENVPDTNVGKWIPCSERLPEEHDSIFKKAKGTDKWRSGMFESISDDVNVTVEFEDGTRTTETSHTLDGKWKCEKEYGIKMKVIAWMPLPSAFVGE